MRLLIDLQACQSSSSKTRGIGRYSLELIKAMLRQGASHDIHLLLNAAFPEAVLELRQLFSDCIGPENIHVWHGLTPCNELDVRNTWRLRANEYIREQAIIEIAPDLVHISSLFEGLSDDAVVSVPPRCGGIPVAVTLYDLIPLINAKPYLENERVRSWYYRKVQGLKRADLLLAISASSRQEGLDFLHLPAERIVNISSAVDERFGVVVDSAEEIERLKKKYRLERDFIMYTGGIDLRKNIEGLIQAYANLSASDRRRFQLAIVCSVHEHDRTRLEKLARDCGLSDGDLVLTGFVPDQELPQLYRACKLFVFPSWHEGFGLPALEAMTCGAPVIAANTSSLPEVVGLEEAMFNPRDLVDMQRKMERGLNDEEFRQRLIEHGLMQSKKFSWDASARVALAALEQSVKVRQTSVAEVPVKRRPRLAYFSPVPPAQSGIADYSAELLPELASYYDIDLIAEQASTSDPWLAANFPIRTVDWFLDHANRFDRVVYNFGNSMFHEYMLDVMALYPGIVVLHDFYHSGLIAHLDLTGRRKGIWDASLFQSHGYQALYKKSRSTDLNSIIWQYPCNQFVLERALGTIVHSGFSKTLARQWYGARAAQDWALIQHLRVLPQQMDRFKARQELGLSDGDFLVCSFGILGPTKLNHLLLQAWLESSLGRDQRCKLVFVGKNDGGEYGAELLATIEKAGVSDRVSITGFADIDLFRRYLQSADAAVQLRGLSRGETSGTVLDCLAYGVPTIINKNGSMAELPDGPLIRLEEDVSPSDIKHHLEQLFQSAELRSQYANAGRKHIQEFHAPDQIGKEYCRAIEAFYSHGAPAALRNTIEKISELDATYEQDDILKAAEVLERNRRGFNPARLLWDTSSMKTMGSKKDWLEFMEQLFEKLPPQIQVLPVNFLDSNLRLAVNEFQGYLSLACQLDEALDSQIVHVNQQDIVLSFDELTQVETLAKVSGAHYVRANFPARQEILIELLRNIENSRAH